MNASYVELPPRPSPSHMRRAVAALSPWRALVEPVWSNMEVIPEERPLLFVGNHTLFGLLDVPILFIELYQQKGICLRGLGDHLHFRVPGWGAFLESFGAVDGTRANCGALMRAGETVLVFPGGGREVAKRKGEKHTLIWKNRIGFIRMALQHGCTIVPFSAVGIEDAYDIRYDTDELMRTPVRHVIQRVGVRSDVIPPLATGVGLTMIPKPHRLYFHFSEPISTRDLQGQQDDIELCFALREEVRSAIADGIAKMRVRQSEDPPVRWRRQTVRAARKIFADLYAYRANGRS